jgi:TMEM175 potassium channel family protein
MSKARMEAFSDAVLAIIITIMVLELKVPHGVELADLRPLIPVFLSYGLSFIYLGIYWSTHHHMLYVTQGVSGAILWANLHLLFWLSLVPFVTGWMGENRLAPAPTAVYGVILLLAGIAYWLLQHAILERPYLRRGRRGKGRGSQIDDDVADRLGAAHQHVAVGRLVEWLWSVGDRP